MLMSGGFREHREGCPTEMELRRAHGCDEDANRVVFRLGGVESRRCPLSRLTDEVYEFLGYFPHYQNGMLPETGGVAEQSATFMAAAAYLAGELARLLEERRKRGEE